MSATPDPVDPDKAARRKKLIGRLMVVGFGLLVLAYVVADVTYRFRR